MTTNNIFTPQYYDYYNINSWLLNQEYVKEYSKIQDVTCISSCRNDVKNNEKLLLVEFEVENYLFSDRRYISNILRIIRTVKEGTIFCENPAYILLESMCDTQLRMHKRISSGKYLSSIGEIIERPLYIWFEYYPKKNNCVSTRYTIKLNEDDLLNDIRTKKQKCVNSLVQLCISAIASNDLEKYNYMNRSMHLSLKTISMV